MSIRVFFKEAIMEMRKERMGEIALLCVLNKARKGPITLGPARIRREAGDMAKELGIELDEASQFMNQIMNQILVETLKSCLEGLKK